ncbi:diaminopimelate decarboxylase [Candidatus Pacearchaeota archaeon]|nr:diaminopimelate decarboxylase [Candidatus Pacearchaeota archaeon]
MSWWETPGHLEVKDNKLLISGFSCEDLAKSFGTPTYVYNENRISDSFSRIKKSLEKHADREVVAYYAVKANYAPPILKFLASKGAYADVVSLNEAWIARHNGFNKDKIMFTGTSVDDATIRYLLDSDILINIDSFSQMKRLAEYKEETQLSGEIDVSVRWNPGLGAGFNPKTITAGAESHGMPIKFGIQEDRLLDLCKEAKKSGINVIGLHQHIGSNWHDVVDFLTTVDSTLNIVRKMTDFLGYDLYQVDFGGGPGIRYEEKQKDFPIEVYGMGICERVKKSGLKFKRIAIEPGRYIVGDSAVLLSRVNTVEMKNNNLIVGVDAGFNTLIRPAFYGAYHEVVDASRVEGSQHVCNIAGPLCETGDMLAVKRTMTQPKEGDVLAILNTGAYGFSMASRYNAQSLPAEVMIGHGTYKLIRRRENAADIIKLYR